MMRNVTFLQVVKIVCLFSPMLCLPGCKGNLGNKLGSDEAIRTDMPSFDISAYSLEKISTKENVWPLVVIGSGPAGLGAALYGARDNIRTLVIKGPKPGGLLMETTYVENWPSERSMRGPDIIKQLTEKVTKEGAQFIDDTVTRVDFSQWPFVIETGDSGTIYALSVVIATGAEPVRLGVPGEDTFFGHGHGVDTCAVCHASVYKNKNVVVVGGGDSAVEMAMQLANYAKSVTILVRKDTMRAASSMQERLKDHPSISVTYNVEVKKIIGVQEKVMRAEFDSQGTPLLDKDGNPITWEDDGTHVTAIEVFNNKTQETSQMPIDGVFLAIGHSPNTQLFKGQVAMDDKGYIKTVGRTYQTTVLGVSVAGEAEDRRYKQAWKSGGDGSAATLDVLAFLRKIGFTKELDQQLTQRRSAQSTQEKSYELPSLENQEQLNQAFSQSKVVVLDFWGKDCSACTYMFPIVSMVAKKYQGKAAFFKVNADGMINEVSELVTKFHIKHMPTILVFKDGRLVARHSGMMEKNDLEALIDQALAA